MISNHFINMLWADTRNRVGGRLTKAKVRVRDNNKLLDMVDADVMVSGQEST